MKMYLAISDCITHKQIGLYSKWYFMSLSHQTNRIRSYEMWKMKRAIFDANSAMLFIDIPYHFRYYKYNEHLF